MNETQVVEKQAHPVWTYKPNSKMFKHHNSGHKRKFVFAANRSGKTFGGEHEIIYHASGLYPSWWRGRTFDRPVEIWIVSPDFPTSRDIVQKSLNELLPKWLKIYGTFSPQRGFTNQTVTVRHYNNGELDGQSIIQFKSSEAGRTSFQGTSQDIIWFDEEFDEAVYDECLMRVADNDGLIIGTMTPIRALLEGVTWLYKRIYQKTDKNNITTMALIDNPIMTPERVKEIRDEIADEDEASVRVDGLFILGAGRPVFNSKIVQEMLDGATDPKEATLIEEQKNIKLVEEEGGWFQYWELPKPEEAYCLGMDVSEGLPKGDESVITVLKRGKVLEQVATFSGLCDPDEGGKRATMIGQFYGFCPVGIEANSIGIASCIAAREMDYPNLYQREVYDSIEKKVTKKIGWQTSKTTRPQLVASGQKTVRNRTIKINSEKTLQQMLTFIRNKKGKPEAMDDKCKDDEVMSLLVAIQMHELTEMEDCEVVYDEDIPYNSEVILQEKDWEALCSIEDRGGFERTAGI